MASRPSSMSSSRSRAARGARRSSPARLARRRLGALVIVAVFGVLCVAVIVPAMQHTIQRIGLPLSHADIIRQQAADKHLDPALVAGVIYAETKFRPRTSAAGAQGLMQILPDTANFIARRSGATRFQTADLGTPQINLAYGCYYLRYLLDRYHGNELLAIAAYNGGEANVDQWAARARSAGHALDQAAIPFPETRDYVARVMQARRDYRANYPRELGLS